MPTLTESDIPLLTDAELKEWYRRRGVTLSGEDMRILRVSTAHPLSSYQYAADTYIRKRLGWEPWAGAEGQPGQFEIIAAYTLALRQMHERDDYEHGRVAAADLKYWQPGQIIQNRIRIEAGHTVGKTKLASGLVNHFFDCFSPSIIYTFAPSWEQIHDLLWKEIKSDRRDKGLPGRILDLQLFVADEHFAKGRATNNAGGHGTERIHGQHGKYLMFVLDEAEGIADYVFNAVDSMASGGIVIVIMLANPQTRTSLFHHAKDNSDTRSFRISCIWHPNVLAGREIVPGAVRRDYVRTMAEKHCDVVTEHSEDDHSFALPFPLDLSGVTYAAGTIFKPNAEFLFRVLGIAPTNIADNTLVPVGRFEAAQKRDAPSEDTARATFGVDVAGFGKDFGTLYIRHLGSIYRAAQMWKLDYDDYARIIKDHALKLKIRGVTKIHIRIDAGGGFGQGVISHLKLDSQLLEAFPGDNLILQDVHFGGTPHNEKAYANTVTEMYAESAETIKGIRIENAPNELEADLCERTYAWTNKSGVTVKILEEKKAFKKRKQRSPDDGDGFVLCASPDHIFAHLPNVIVRHSNTGPQRRYGYA